jgi:hypothetical protein
MENSLCRRCRVLAGSCNPRRVKFLQLRCASKRNAEYRVLLKNGKAVKTEPTGAKTVAGANEMLQKADFSRLFPVGTETSLVRVGFVNCHQSVCEFILQ